MLSRDELLNRLRALSEDTEPFQDAFKEKLQDWVDLLNEGFPDVESYLEAYNSVAMHVKFWPKYRPAEKVYMFSVVRRGSLAVLLGEKEVAFKEPNDLWEHFVGLLEDPVFQQSLLEFKRRNLEPSSGFLKTKTYDVIGPKDVVVDVSSDEIKRIALGETGPYKVREVEGTSYARFDPKTRYTFLSVAGYLVRISSAVRSTDDDSMILVDTSGA